MNFDNVKSNNNSKHKFRLFCFPYAGSSAVVTYKYLVDYLPAFIDVYPVELPGRGARMSEPLVDNIDDILDEIYKSIKDFLDIPFIFLGHSMGGLISYELSHFLLSNFNLSPRKIYVSAHRAPFIQRDGIIMHKLNKADFINELIAMNGIAPEILEHEELLDLILPIIRNDYKLCENYNYLKKDILEIPITVFGGTNDKDVSKEHLLMWSDLTKSKFENYLFDSDHFFIIKEKKLFGEKLLNLLQKDILELELNKRNAV